MLPALLAFIGLACVQVMVGVVYKLSQRETGGGSSYTFNPSSALTISELIKLAMSSASYIVLVYRTTRSAAPLPSTTDEVSALVSYSALPLSDSSIANSNGSGHSESPGREVRGEEPIRVAMDEEMLPEPPVTAAQPSFLSLLRERAASEMSRSLFFYLAGLACLYCFNNQLTFILFRLADSASVSLFKSGSTAMTAVLLWSLFSRPIVGVQWASIALQTAGLMVVQYNPTTDTSTYPSSTYLLLLLSTAITAVSSVWNEQTVKRYECSLHLQNATLYAIGSLLNGGAYLLSVHNADLSSLVFSSSSSSGSISFFDGYNAAALLVIACNSVLGIVITAVYKYADAVIKTFATASATGALLLINSSIFGVHANTHAYLGTAVVFIACYTYFKGSPATPAPAPAPSAPSDGVSRTSDAPDLGDSHTQEGGGEWTIDKLHRRQELPSTERRNITISLLAGALLATLAWSALLTAPAAPLTSGGEAVSSPQSSASTQLMGSLGLCHALLVSPSRMVTLYGWGLPSQELSPSSLVEVDHQPCLVTAGDVGFIKCMLPPLLSVSNNTSNTSAFSPVSLTASSDGRPLSVTYVPVTVSVNESASNFTAMHVSTSVPLRRIVSHWERLGTVLVLMFSTSHPERIPFLKRHYSRIFSSVVVVGHELIAGVDVVCPQSFQGRGAHICLSEIATIHRPGRSGYFLLQFDVAINWYNLERFNPSNIWWIKPGARGDYENWGWWGDKSSKREWFFWGQEGPLLENLHKEIADILSNDTNSFYSRYVTNSVNNIGPWNSSWIMGPTDAFYLPARFVDDWAKLACASCILAKNRNMGEVAFLQLTVMVAPNISVDVEPMSGAWGHDSDKIHDQYWLHSDYVYFHKVALHNTQGQVLVATSVERSIPSESNAHAAGPPLLHTSAR